MDESTAAEFVTLLNELRLAESRAIDKVWDLRAERDEWVSNDPGLEGYGFWQNDEGFYAYGPGYCSKTYPSVAEAGRTLIAYLSR